MKRCLFLSILCLVCTLSTTTTLYAYQSDSSVVFRILSYNVENLFHPNYDSINLDEEFTPKGKRHWTYGKYQNKVENIARVITTIYPWNTIDIIGLCEVENRQCVDDLNNILKRFHFKVVHHDSSDPRGIDVALLYRPATFRLLQSYPIQINLGNSNHTRDILYVSGLNTKGDTLHIFLCHLPSQIGGIAETEWKRKIIKNTLQQHIDSIYFTSEKAKIIVMGDMNSTAKDDLSGMKNLMIPFQKQSIGSYKYKGIWYCLDQFYISPSLEYNTSVSIYNSKWIQEEDERYLDYKPKRTYVGYRYQNGYSDHLPIILEITY